MENISGSLGPLKLARQLNECMLEKEALERQVEGLKAQLQTAENHSACQEEKVQELTTKLERQMIQTESLQRQVDDLLLQGKSSQQQDQGQELNDSSEHDTRLELTKELEETKEKLAYQKKLKEMYINQGKETRDELERLMRLCDKETTDTMRMASEIAIDIKKRQKKELAKELETLKVAHIISQQKFSAELQVEKDQNEALQQELERLKVSHQVSLMSISVKLAADREIIDSLQKQLKEIQSEAKCLSEMLELMKQLNNKKDVLLQQKEEEIQILGKNASEKEKHLFKGLEDLKEKLSKQTSTYQDLVTKLRAEQEVSQGLRTALAEFQEEQKDRTSEEEEEKSEEKLEKENKKLLPWKKFKLRMGFRKE